MAALTRHPIGRIRGNSFDEHSLHTAPTRREGWTRPLTMIHKRDNEGHTVWLVSAIVGDKW